MQRMVFKVIEIRLVDHHQPWECKKCLQLLETPKMKWVVKMRKVLLEECIADPGCFEDQSCSIYSTEWLK